MPWKENREGVRAQNIPLSTNIMIQTSILETFLILPKIIFTVSKLKPNYMLLKKYAAPLTPSVEDNWRIRFKENL